MSILKYFLLLTVVMNVALASSNELLFTPEKKDRYLCEYSNIMPTSGKLFGYHRRNIRLTKYDLELDYYKMTLKKRNIKNFNSLTTTKMSEAFHFNPAQMQNAAKSLGFHRNAYERYAVVRLLARKKIENLMLGLDEAVKYLRWNPSQHPDFAKKELGFFESFFYDEPKKPLGKSYQAYAEIPQACLDQDGYINTLKATLKQKRVRAVNQTNFDSSTGEKYYSELSSDSKIFQFEQKKSLYSFQLRLKNSFQAIEKLKKLQVSINEKEVKRLDNFIYFLKEGYRLRHLQSVESADVRKQLIKETKELSLWRNHIGLLFSNNKRRKKYLAKIKNDHLAHALMQMPPGMEINKKSWEVARTALKNKVKQIDLQIAEIKQITPILQLDYNEGIGNMNLLKWLGGNQNELKPSIMASFSSLFDVQIQKALAHNVLRFQIPALKRTCNFLKMDVNKMICPEDNILLQELILNRPLMNAVQNDNKWMAQAGSNMIIDHYVTGAKEIQNSMIQVGAFTAVTFGTGAIVAALSGSAKLAGVAYATKAASTLTRASTALKIMASGKKVAEVSRIAHTALDFYLFGSAIYNVNSAWDRVNQTDENAHSTVETLPWGSLQAVENAWLNFYISAGVATTMGVLTKAQLSRFTKESLIVKNGVAYIKNNTPTKILNLLRKSNIVIKKSKPISLLRRFRSKHNIMTDAFKRSIDKSKNINAGTKDGTLQAQVVTEQNATQFQKISQLHVGKNVEGIPSGTTIIRDGKLMAEEWKMVLDGKKITFIHQSSSTQLELSSRFFHSIKGASEYSLKVKSGAAWAGISKGLRALEAIPGGTNSLGYGLFRVGMTYPLNSIKWLGGIMGGGMKLAIGSTVVTATGLTLYINYLVNNGILGAAKKLEEFIPPHWSGFNATLTQLIGRWEKEAINQAERKATEREFYMQHKVRGVLDSFQNATNDLENRLTHMEVNKWYIEDYIRRLSVEENEITRKEQKAQLQSFLNQQRYSIYRFEKWLQQKQKSINYHAQEYMFFSENQRLFDKYWDYYFTDRAQTGLANDFSLQKNGDTIIMRYGMWQASHPYNGEVSDELLAILSIVEKNKETFNHLSKRVEKDFGIIVAKLNSEFDKAKPYVFERSPEGETTAHSLLHAIKMADEELTEKEMTLNSLERTFLINYRILLKQKGSVEERQEATSRLIGTVERLYTLSMRDFYRWKWHTKDLLEAKLFQLKGLNDQQRYNIRENIKKLSKHEVSIKEKQSSKGIVLSLDYGHWRISTSNYEDNIKMKKFDIMFEERIISIEKKVLELKSKNLIEANLELELTSY